MKKFLFIRTTILILIVLSISINFFIPNSLAQNDQVGMQENINVTVKHHNQPINDSLSLSEPTIVRTIDREATLEQQVNDLTQEVQNANNVSILIGVAGISASIVAYRLAKRDLKSTIDQSVEKTVEKTVEVANAQLRVKEGGKVAIREGKVIGEHKRTINEPHIPVTESIDVKVTRVNDQKIVAENKKEFKVDAVIANASDTKSDEIKDNKSEMNKKKDDLSKGVKLD